MRHSLFAASLIFAVSSHADENASLASTTQRCCSAAGCVEQPGDVPCAVEQAVHALVPSLRLPDPAIEAQIAEEMAAPVTSFANPTRPAVTPRGILSIALTYETYRHVFVGTIEGEYAQMMPHPDAPGLFTPMTWCSIRVHEAFRGGGEGELVTVLFEGGSLSADYAYWPPHTPRCLPLDYGVFSVYEKDGVLRASDRATMSMLSDLLPWQAHPLTLLLRELRAELEAGQ